MSTAPAQTLEMKRTQLYINGEWADGEKSDGYDVINPATEDTLATVAYGTGADARRALEAAEAALPGWRGSTVYDRAAKLKKIADLMREQPHLLTRRIREIHKIHAKYMQNTQEYVKLS